MAAPRSCEVTPPISLGAFSMIILAISSASRLPLNFNPDFSTNFAIFWPTVAKVCSCLRDICGKSIDFWRGNQDKLIGNIDGVWPSRPDSNRRLAV